MKKTLLFFVIASIHLCPGRAQNLILNHSCDDALVNGDIPNWTEVIGTNWKQRCSIPDPLPENGSCYFFAGADSLDVLAQTIDVSGYAPTIDNGLQTFYFHGYEISYSSLSTDEANLYIEFSNAVDTLLSSIHFGPYTQSIIWQELDSALQVPPLTRKVTIRLQSVRHDGSNNDGYYDELYLGPSLWVGTSDIKSDPVLSIYPNPASSNLSVCTNFENGFTIQLIDINGKLVQNVTTNTKFVNLDISSIGSGIYFARIFTDGTSVNKEVSIVK